jgi:hypothetical protein
LRASSMGSQVLSHLRLICVISIIESMTCGTYYFTQGLKYDMDVYMMTLFEGEA